MLAEDDLAIYAFDYDYLTFGSWAMVAGSRHRRVRIQFDGKEEHLEVSQATVGDSRSSLSWHALSSPTLERGVGADPGTLFKSVGATIKRALQAK
jgi:hypothetical protein